jgi:hypothetical protein
MVARNGLVAGPSVELANRTPVAFPLSLYIL